VAVFNEGSLQQVDSPAALYEKPQNAFVAEFIGDNNLVPATVEAIEGNACRVTLPTGETACASVAATTVAPGAAVLLSLRPEHIGLSEAENEIGGVVKDVIYHGDHVRILVAAAGLAEMMVKLPGRTDPPSPGSAVRLGFRAQDCLALPQELQ